METRYPLIQSPLTLGSVTLRNRLVFPPFETNYATAESFPTEKHIHLYRRIAAGGVGMIVLEATNVNPKITPTKYGLGIVKDDYIAPLRKLTDAIHGQGAAVLLQIVDKTALEEGRYGTEMSRDEVKELIGFFVEAIVRAEKAGFDGVDFHAAHLYTLGDFISRNSNKRKDEYGGSLEGRLRILEETFLRAKALVGQDFIFACRYSGDHFVFGENTLKDGIAIGRHLEKLGFDLLDISAGGRIEPILKAAGGYSGFRESYSGSRACPTSGYPDAVNIHLPEGIKAAVKGIPVLGCGKIGTLKLAEQVLRQGKADLVGMARAIFCDPELPTKAFEGRENERLRCTWCNACLRLYMSDQETVCVRWPGVKVKI